MRSSSLLHPRLFLSLALLAASPAARADPSPLAAPLGIGTPGPIRQLFLDPLSADARAVGTPALTLRLETGNSWSVPTTVTRGGHTVQVQLDAQADAFSLAARLPWSTAPGDEGWRKRVATTLAWRITGFWGGFEDGGIEAWHRLVGAFNFQRDRYPRDQLNLTLQEPGGPVAFDLRSGRISPGDLVVGTQVLLLSGGTSVVRGSAPADPRWGVAARLDLKAPTGALDLAGGSGGVDAGLVLLGTVELASWAVFHGMVLGTLTSPIRSDVALQPELFHYGFETSFVLMAGNFALVLEDRWLSQLMEDGWTVQDGGSNAVYISSAAAALFRQHNQISGGIRYRGFTVTFSEDFTLGSNPRALHDWYFDTNAPDVVLGFTFIQPL
jgi:hypothetical protein